MKYKRMTLDELTNNQVGEAITVTAVMAVAVIAVMAVVIYQLFLSKKGTVAVPGGWKFTWN